MLKIAPHLSLPIEAVTQTFALLARRGAGKTHTASVIAEEMLDAGFPIVVLDPVGVWFGLRSLYPVAIFGGERGDMPLQATGGRLVAEFLLTKTQQRIIDAIAWYESLGTNSPTLTQIGAVALIDPTGGHFSNTVGPLSTSGLVERGDGRMSLTDSGRSLTRPIEAAESLDGYHDVLRQRIRKMKSAGGKTIEMLNVIIAAGGADLSVEEIGTAVGIDHTGGHFSNMIGPLGTAGLIKRSSGKVTPTEVLFPEGLS